MKFVFSVKKIWHMTFRYIYSEWINFDNKLTGNKFQRYACRSHCLTLLVHHFMLYCFVTFLPCSFDPIWAPEPWPFIYIILFEAFNESIGDDMATNGYQWSIKISTNCLTPFRQYLCTQSIFDWPTSSITPNPILPWSTLQRKWFLIEVAPPGALSLTPIRTRIFLFLQIVNGEW